MIVPREEVRQMAPELRTCWDLVLSTFEGGEYAHCSGVVLLSGGESLCLGTSLPSELLPPGLAGLEQRDVVGPELLPATEKEEETERVGLSWFPRKSWYGTVARIGCNRTAVVLLPQEEHESGGELLCLTRCGEELASAVDADITSR